MTSISRQDNDRRAPDRRKSAPPSHTFTERRETSRRGYMDRRDTPFWRFNWLRMSVSQQLAA